MSERTVGDTGPDVTGNVSANLTGATSVTAHIRRPDGSTFSRTAQPGGGVDGAWSMPLQTGDLTTGGLYYVELEVVFGNGKTQTFADTGEGLPAYFPVRDQYA